MSVKELKDYLLVSSLLGIEPNFKGLNIWKKLVRRWGVKWKKKDIETILKCYEIVGQGVSNKMEGKTSEGKDFKVYSMGENNPIIRIDIKK